MWELGEQHRAVEVCGKVLGGVVVRAGGGGGGGGQRSYSRRGCRRWDVSSKVRSNSLSNLY